MGQEQQEALTGEPINHPTEPSAPKSVITAIWKWCKILV